MPVNAILILGTYHEGPVLAEIILPGYDGITNDALPVPGEYEGLTWLQAGPCDIN